MQCPRTGLILRLVGVELSSWEEEDLRQHLTDCPACQATWNRLRETWQELGEWQVVPPRDRQEAIVGAVTELMPERGAGLFQGIGRGRILRIAASLALATGLGIAAGKVAPIPDSQSGQSEWPAPSDTDVAESLGITELGTGPATGLGRGLVRGKTSEEKEASS